MKEHFKDINERLKNSKKAAIRKLQQKSLLFYKCEKGFIICDALRDLISVTIWYL